MLILELGLQFLIYTEAANLRHTPHLMFLIYYIMRGSQAFQQVHCWLRALVLVITVASCLLMMQRLVNHQPKSGCVIDPVFHVPVVCKTSSATQTTSHRAAVAAVHRARMIYHPTRMPSASVLSI